MNDVGPSQDHSIQKLLDMGFSRTDAEKELQSCGGNVEMAIIKLLARNLKSH